MLNRFGRKAAALLTSAMVLSSFVAPLPAAAVSLPNLPGLPPSVATVQTMVSDQTKLTIQWNKAPFGGFILPGHATTLHGTGTGVFGKDFTIDCNVTYPPLKVRCTISFDLL